MKTPLSIAGVLLFVGIVLVIAGVWARRQPAAPVPSPARPTASAQPARHPAVAGERHAATVLSATDFTYAGRWELVRGLHDGRYAGMSGRSYEPGAKLTVGFTGRAISIYGVDGPGGGTGTIQIDGRTAASHVSFSAPHKRTHALVFISPPLSPGRHRLTVTVEPAGAGHVHHAYVNVDAAAVTP